MDKEPIILTMIIFILILPIICIFYIENSNHEIIEIQVKDKYVKGDFGEYMIVDMNNMTYRISYYIDDLLGDVVYNKIEIGKKYKVKTRGKRIPKLGTFKNIYKIEEIKER